jgi:hypothetical protein
VLPEGAAVQCSDEGPCGYSGDQVKKDDRMIAGHVAFVEENRYAYMRAIFC